MNKLFRYGCLSRHRWGGDVVDRMVPRVSLRDTLGFALKREGYRADLHASGLAAWHTFERELPDLAILDILLPEMDGLELCRRDRDALQRPEHIGEPQPDEANVSLFQRAQHEILLTVHDVFPSSWCAKPGSGVFRDLVTTTLRRWGTRWGIVGSGPG